MTFSEIKTEIDNRCDDVISDARKKVLVNLTLDAIFATGDRWPFSEIIKQDTSQTTVSGTNTYNLPTGTSKIISVYVGSRKYSRIDLQDNTDTSLATGNVYTVSTWPTDNDTGVITLYSTPTSDGETITITYEAEATEFEEDSDTPGFARRFHEIFVYGALERYYETERSFSNAKYYAALFDEKLVELRDFYFRPSADDSISAKTLSDTFTF